jgi:Tfp pilus assembly protein PilX
MSKFTRQMQAARHSQRGVSTLVITILLLVIITLVVLFSTSVGFIEQRTALNENRARIAEQAAETGINRAGEYIKANRELIISKGANGWLDTVAGGAGWVSCNAPGVTATLGSAPHPCMSESDATRRAQLWFYTTDGTGATAATTYLPYGAINTVGTAGFASTVNVQAVLCRVDTTLTTPACVQAPAGGNRIAVTFISTATLTDENTTSVIKETWASFSTSAFSSAVPLVASGIIKGLGNSQIVASPNAGGYGVAASMWSPNNIGFGTKNANACTDGSTPGAGGLGSSSTCHVEDYLFGTTVEPNAIKTGCAAKGAPCKCPSEDGRYLSGHVGIDKAEGIDILDVDKIPLDPDYSAGFGPLPDITFYPGSDCKGNQMDGPSDALDDSLFEWTFGVDVVTEGTATTKNTTSVRQTCSSADPTGLAGNPGQDCAVYALTNDLGATSITCAALNTLGSAATGLYYVTDSTGCSFTSEIGSATQSVVVVVEQSVDIKDNFFGLLFVRSKNNTADVRFNGNSKLFGAMVIEGDIDLTGTIDIVYEDVSVSSDPFTFPKSAKFARVPGSWLDATTGF